MSHDEIIAVVLAHKEGKIIQTRSHFHPLEGWQNCNPNWDFYQYDYRVAPEPRKPRDGWVHESSILNENHVAGHCGYVKVREVID